MRNKRDKSGRDAAIARLAANQHGVVTTTQLLTTGLSRGRISERAAAGRLHPIHRGVYAVGHTRLGDRGRWMAAVLAYGAGAVLSHTSAAELWGIRRSRPADVHVTVPRTCGLRRRDAIVLHRSSTLGIGDCTRRDGIPVTTPTRTLADLRPLRMLALCRRHRLHQPAVNVTVDRFEVDFLWRAERLVVEVDGWESHRSRSAFEEDRTRDARLKVLGYEVLRFTWRQITRDRAAVATTIRALLVARAA